MAQNNKPKVERASAIDHAIAMKQKLLNLGFPEEIAERGSFDKYIKELALDVSETLTRSEEILKQGKKAVWISIALFIGSILFNLLT